MAASFDDAESSWEEDEEETDDDRCPVCLEDVVTLFFLLCRHKVCRDCAERLYTGTRFDRFFY